MTQTLPQTAPCSWSGEILRLRFPLSKIWTQETSRQFGIYWNTALQFGRLWPEPTNAELQSFYDIKDYDRYLSGGEKKEVATKTLLSRIVTKIAWLSDKSDRNVVQAIQELKPNGKSACDIGCGSGAYLANLKSRGLSVTGIDPSHVSAAAVAAKGIEFFEGTAENLPAAAAGRQFDVVSMFQSLEHCRSPLKAVKNAASLLTTDGLLVIEVPNMGCHGFEFYGPAWWHTDAGRHLQFFTRGSLDRLITGAGLKVVKWEYQGFTMQFNQDWIAEMTCVWDAIKPETPRPTFSRSAALLPVAAFSSDDLKYDVIRLYAKRS